MVSKSIILALFFISITQTVTGDVAHKRVQKNYIASDSAKKIMKKHGIHTMYEDWNGKWWFKRDGKKIFLEGKDE